MKNSFIFLMLMTKYLNNDTKFGRPKKSEKPAKKGVVRGINMLYNLYVNR